MNYVAIIFFSVLFQTISLANKHVIYFPHQLMLRYLIFYVQISLGSNVVVKNSMRLEYWLIIKRRMWILLRKQSLNYMENKIKLDEHVTLMFYLKLSDIPWEDRTLFDFIWWQVSGNYFMRLIFRRFTGKHLCGEVLLLVVETADTMREGQKTTLATFWVQIIRIEPWNNSLHKRGLKSPSR